MGAWPTVALTLAATLLITSAIAAERSARAEGWRRIADERRWNWEQFASTKAAQSRQSQLVVGELHSSRGRSSSKRETQNRRGLH